MAGGARTDGAPDDDDVLVGEVEFLVEETVESGGLLLDFLVDVASGPLLFFSVWVLVDAVAGVLGGEHVGSEFPGDVFEILSDLTQVLLVAVEV